MNKSLLLLGSFLCLASSWNHANANEQFLIIDSDLADYDGSKITLTGNVVIEHEIGSISAENLVVFPNQGKKKSLFSSIQMENNVKISFHHGGELSCAYAHINSLSMEGKFKGSFQQEYVIYSESYEDKMGQAIPILLKSREMQVNIQKSSDEQKSLFASISSLTAKDNVTVNYNHDFIALADQGVYQRDAGEIPGEISMQAKDHFGICQATNRNGDTIHSSRMRINPTAKQLIFDSPKGFIQTKEEGETSGHLDFSCKTLIWDENHQALSLSGDVLISGEGIGQISNAQNVKIDLYHKNEKKYLRQIESEGETHLHYVDPSRTISHSLTCYGKLVLDHEHLQMHIDSPVQTGDEFLTVKQVYFQDRLGEIYADRALISYDYIKGKITPVKITLLGHVQILNRTTADAEDKGKFLQYAVADKVQYFPLKNKMYFKSEGNHRVLFFDKSNNIKVSAPALKVVRNPGSKKDSIQGLGDVRFSFIEEELEELRKRFNIQEEG